MPNQDTSPEAIAQFLEEVNKQLEEGVDQIEEAMLHADPFGDDGEVTHKDAAEQALADEVAAVGQTKTPDPSPLVRSDTRTDEPSEPALVEAAVPSQATKTVTDADVQPKDGEAGTFMADAGKLGITGVGDLPDKIDYNGETFMRLHMNTQGCACYLSSKGSNKIEVCGVV